MKYNDNGTFKDIYVKASDTLPIGSIVEFDGTEIPDGWESAGTGKIKKIETSFGVLGKVLNSKSNSQSDTYSCEMIHKEIENPDRVVYANDFKCKNLLNQNIQTQTKNGITFTVNNDKSITINGTASSETYFNLNNEINSATQLESGKTYTLSIGVNMPSSIRFKLRRYSVTQDIISIDIGSSSKTYTAIADETTFAYVQVQNGQTINNLTIYPQIELGDTATEYVEHIEYGYSKMDYVASNYIVSGTTLAAQYSSIKKRGDYVSIQLTVTSNLSNSSKVLENLPVEIRPTSQVWGYIMSSNGGNWVGRAFINTNGELYVLMPQANTSTFIKIDYII